MATDRGDLPPADWDGETFGELSRAEEGRVGVVLMPLDPESDTWFWDYLLPGGEHEAKSFAIDAPAVVGGTGGELTLHLQGAAPGAHELRVQLGGVDLGFVSLGDLDASSVTLPVPPGTLVDGTNQVELRSQAGDLVFVDALELAYERHNRPLAGRLLLRADGHSTLTAAPFAGPEILVLDLADPLRPREVAPRVLTESDGFRAVWNADGDGPYLVADNSGRLSPVLERDAPSSLEDPAHQVDYLLITTEDLLAAADQLAAHRESQGLRTLVVEVQDVYDTFRHGVRDPRAIRDLLAFAHGGWAVAPRYVVIAGAGHYDYRDYLGYGGNRVPPLQASNGTSLYASDSTFADVNGDGLPEMAIGRIPAHSAAQLGAFVDKLIAREAAGAGGRIDLLSDAPDGDTVFADAGDQLASVLGDGWRVSHIDLGSLPLADARQQLFSSLAEGRGWLHYSGHGGVDRLSNGGLLTSADVPGLDVGGLPPILSSVTCHIGLHALPGFDALGEHLLNEPASGAVAVFGPTWLSTHAEAVYLADRLFRQAFLRAPATLGDAMVEAIRSAAAVGVDLSIL
ncbi:MAG: C25 family cysteine peptidase, partial [Holophagales bacterium]|nr:C25 family cysteine peptidase [Holophagales bacterium]